MEELSQQELNQKIERFLKNRLAAHPEVNDITEKQQQKSRSFIVKVKGYVGRQLLQRITQRWQTIYQHS